MSHKKNEPYINQSLWGCDGRFFIPGIEDNLLTKGGVCRDNSLIATAILDLMDVPHYHFCNTHHAMIWLQQWNYWYTNGVTAYIPKAGKWWTYKAFQKLLFTRIYNRGRGFNFYKRKGNTITTYPQKKIIIAFLKSIISKIGNDTHMGCSKKNFLSADKMLLRLQKKNFQQIKNLRKFLRFNEGEKIKKAYKEMNKISHNTFLKKISQKLYINSEDQRFRQRGKRDTTMLRPQDLPSCIRLKCRLSIIMRAAPNISRKKRNHENHSPLEMPDG